MITTTNGKGLVFPKVRLALGASVRPRVYELRCCIALYYEHLRLFTWPYLRVYRAAGRMMRAWKALRSVKQSRRQESVASWK